MSVKTQIVALVMGAMNGLKATNGISTVKRVVNRIEVEAVPPALMVFFDDEKQRARDGSRVMFEFDVWVRIVRRGISAQESGQLTVTEFGVQDLLVTVVQDALAAIDFDGLAEWHVFGEEKTALTFPNTPYQPGPYVRAMARYTRNWGDAGLPVASFVSVGQHFSSVSGFTVAMPALIQAGDVLLLFVQSANQPGAAPAGWTQVAGSPQGVGIAAAAGSVALEVFYLRYTGIEAAPALADRGDHAMAVIMAFRPITQAGSPVDASSGRADVDIQFQVFGDTVTTIGPNRAVVYAIAHPVDVPGPQLSAFVNPGGFTNMAVRFNQGTATGRGGGIAVVTGDKRVAGLAGTFSATVTAPCSYVAIALALKP